MSAKHTLGPWHHDRENFADWGWVRDSRGHLVAKCVVPIGTDENHHRASGSDPTAANARLIAAAPDLLKALEDCIAVMDNELHGLAVIQPELAAARAAIAKTVGKEGA